MAIPGITPKRGRKPIIQKVSVRAASHALAGPEQPFPVYTFSRRIFIERPGHNPFSVPSAPTVPVSFDSGFDTGFA
jgi:hypothetical protein